MVYIIRAVSTPFVKIGVCTDISRRLRALQTDTPFDLEVVCVFYNEDRVFEQKLHRRFLKQRVRGEWFRLEGDLVPYIEANQITDKIREFLCLPTHDGLTDYERRLEKDSQELKSFGTRTKSRAANA